MAQILLIDDDLNLLQMVRLMLQRLGHQVITSRNGDEGLRLASEIQPDLAIIDIMMPGLSGYDVVNQLRRDPKTRRVPIIILTARSQPMDKHKALQAGANAFISKPVTAQELADRVEAVLEAGVDFRINTGLLAEPVSTDLGPPPPTTGTPDYPAPTRQPTGPFIFAQPRTTPPDGPRSDVTPLSRPDAAPRATTPLPPLPLTVVIGLRGGTGSTTLAVNVACWLAPHEDSLVLLDLSTDSGHVPLHLHLSPPRHWGMLLRRHSVPDARVVQGLVVKHAASGVSVVAAPPVPTLETLESPYIDGLLQQLGSAFGHMVIDAPHLDPATAVALKRARQIMLVMSDDPASVQTTIQSLTAFEQIGVDPGRIKIVLNHTHRMRDIPAETIQKVVKRTLAAEIPFEPEQVNAVRRGTPLVSASPGSAFARAVEQLGQQLAL